MKLIMENWKRFLNEDETGAPDEQDIDIVLPVGSNVRYNIEDGGVHSGIRVPSPFKREYKFVPSADLPSNFYFGGPKDLNLEDVTIGSRKGGIGAPAIRNKEAGLYVTGDIGDAEKYAAKNVDGVVYGVTIAPGAKTYSYSGEMMAGRSWIVNFSEKDWLIFKNEGIQALYDPISEYLIVLDKEIIQTFGVIK